MLLLLLLLLLLTLGAVDSCRFDTEQVEEYDSERRLSALSSLSTIEGVKSLYTAHVAPAMPDAPAIVDAATTVNLRRKVVLCGRQHHVLLPVVLSLLHTVGDEDLAMRSAAVAAAQCVLTALVKLLPEDCDSVATARRSGAWYVVCDLRAVCMRDACGRDRQPWCDNV